jgi:hypothetical protein
VTDELEALWQNIEYFIVDPAADSERSECPVCNDDPIKIARFTFGDKVLPVGRLGFDDLSYFLEVRPSTPGATSSCQHIILKWIVDRRVLALSVV